MLYNQIWHQQDSICQIAKHDMKLFWCMLYNQIWHQQNSLFAKLLNMIWSDSNACYVTKFDLKKIKSSIITSWYVLNNLYKPEGCLTICFLDKNNTPTFFNQNIHSFEISKSEKEKRKEKKG
jgi:hypothetical protein